MNQKVGDRSQSVMVSSSNTFFPGYLQVSLEKTSIRFPDDIQVSGKGGTAKVIKCKLKAPKMIEK